MTDYKNIGNNLKLLRTTNTELQPHQVSEQLNLSRAMYYKIESGATKLTVDNLLALCKLYRCTPNNILSGQY